MFVLYTCVCSLYKLCHVQHAVIISLLVVMKVLYLHDNYNCTLEISVYLLTRVIHLIYYKLYSCSINNAFMFRSKVVQTFINMAGLTNKESTVKPC